MNAPAAPLRPIARGHAGPSLLAMPSSPSMQEFCTKSRPVVILADTRPGAPEIMFGIEHMGLPVAQSAKSLGEVGKFALGYARAAPVGMLLAGLFDKAVLP